MTPAALQQIHDGPRLNLGCGDDVRDGWVNLDAFYRHPAVVRHDITQTPWPFLDESFELIEAAHVLEHVPLVYPVKDGVRRDVIFDIFEEAWRVLRPGGVFRISVPWGSLDPRVDHIQHYRGFVPETFNVFDPQNAEHFYSTAAFRVASWSRGRRTEHFPAKRWLPLGKSRLGALEHLSIRVPLTRRLLARAAELKIDLVKVDQEVRVSSRP